MAPPRCFISYSWDSEAHREWVRKLATRLRECGIDAILDQFHCAPGMDLTQFMERSVRESSYVVLVCTPNFGQKADAGVGGVGYEKAIVTGEIFAGEAKDTKFVPVLREGDPAKSLPSYLRTRLFIDFRVDDFFEARLEELLRHFHGEPLYPLPPIGPKPDWKRHMGSSTTPKLSLSKTVRKSTTPAPTHMTPMQQQITNSIGIEFVLILAGRFKMGSGISPEEVVSRYGGEVKWFENEHPQHDVKISHPFYLQNTPVTVGQWRRFIEDTGFKTEAEIVGGAYVYDGSKWEEKKGAYWDNPFFLQEDHHPVNCVSWNDAIEFIRWLNQIEGKNIYRLPTEAEWEFACRANATNEFSFGNDPEQLGDYAWFSNNSDNKTHPVGS
jgi:hypothetical protein